MNKGDGNSKKREIAEVVFPLRTKWGAADPPDVEVLHIDVPVGGSLPLAPQQQTLLSRSLWTKTEKNPTV